MSGSASSKAYYEEIAKLEPMEMTFTIEDADLDKLNDMLKDINVKECPWFEVHDKHGNKAKYYREPLSTAKYYREPISYQDCSNAMLKMWTDNVLTDGEYNRIMDKLNAKYRGDSDE